MLTAVAWLAFVMLAALFVVLAVQRHRWAQREQLARSLGIASAITGSLLGWMLAAGARAAAAGLIAGIAVGVVGVLIALRRIWQDVKAGEDRTVGASLAAAAVALSAALKDARDRSHAARQKRQAAHGTAAPPVHLVPPLEAGPGRTPPNRRRAAPPPLPPDADPAPGPVRPRFAVTAGNIAPDHAAAHERIANFEPAGLREHVDFLTREARSFAGYGPAFEAYADTLIHGPGVHPAALRPTFDFADGFGEVSTNLGMAVKRFLDYFRDHLEWAESHDPTKDGHWTIRD